MFVIIILLILSIVPSHQEIFSLSGNDYSGYCLLQNTGVTAPHKIKNCTETPEIVVNNTVACTDVGGPEEACWFVSSHYFLESEVTSGATGTGFTCESSIYGEALCDQNCQIGHENANESTLSCSGDSFYQTYNPSYVVGGQCFCTRTNYTTMIVYVLDNPSHSSSVGPVYWATVSYKRPKEEALLIRPHKLVDDALINVDYKRPTTLVVKNEHKVEIKLLVRKDDFSDLFTIGAVSTRTFQLPSRIHHISGNMYGDAYLNGTLREQNVFWVTAISECNFPDCFFCTEFWTAYRCVPLRIQIGVAILIGAVIFAICVMFPWAALFMWWTVQTSWSLATGVTKGLYNISRSRMARVIKRKAASVKDSINENLLTASDPAVDDIALPTRRRPNGDTTEFKLLFIFLILGLNVRGVESCSQVALTKASYKSCNDTVEGFRSCKVEINTQVTIPYPGQTACFTLLNENNVPIIMVNLSYIYLRKTVNTKKLYYTSKWNMFYQSERNCRNRGQCKNSRCENLLPSDKTCKGECSKNEVVNYPGLARCDRTCGCAGCACLICSDACVYSAYGLVPTGNYYEIRELGEVEYNPYLEISFRKPDGTATSKIIDASPLEGVLFNNMRFKILGTLAASNPSFYSKKLAISNNNYYFVDAAPLNAPVRAIIGDFQFDSVSKITTPGANNGKFDPSIVTYNLGDKSVHYFTVNNGVTSEKFTQKLPNFYGTELWDYTDGFVYSNSSVGGALILSIVTEGDFDVQVTTSQVCPVAELVESSGCFKCDLGCVSRIKIKSTCDAGFISISSDSKNVIILTKSLQIGTDEQTFDVHFQTGAQINNFNLVLEGNGHSIDVGVEFTASEENTVNNDTYSQGNGTIHTGGGGGSIGGGGAIGKGIGNWFKHIFDWTGGIIDKIILVVIIAVVAVAGGYVVYQLWQWKKMKKMKSL